MPLVNKRDPGGWMSPALQKSNEEQPKTPIFAARSESVAHPVISVTGSPDMPYSRIALVGLQ